MKCPLIVGECSSHGSVSKHKPANPAGYCKSIRDNGKMLLTCSTEIPAAQAHAVSKLISLRGGVGERLKPPVLKTGVVKATAGSNPAPSANKY